MNDRDLSGPDPALVAADKWRQEKEARMTSPEHTLRGKLIQALNGAMPTPDDAIAILNRWDELVAERDELTRRLKLEYETRMDTRKMLEAAEALEFEKAAKLRDRIRELREMPEGGAAASIPSRGAAPHRGRNQSP